MPQKRMIALPIKIAYTMFLCLLVPFYWINYGPQNFLWFCDLALLLTLPALWRESSLLASIPTVGILLPQLMWIIDFLFQLITGKQLLGIAAYMFDPQIPLFVRGLSSFHGWLPVLLFWMVWKLGYDCRALPAQVGLGSLALLLSFGLSERPRPFPALAGVTLITLAGLPPAPFASVLLFQETEKIFDKPNWATNVNWVFGFGSEVQTLMSPVLYLALQLAFYPLAVYLPTHFLLRRLMKNRMP